MSGNTHSNISKSKHTILRSKEDLRGSSMEHRRVGNDICTLQ